MRTKLAILLSTLSSERPETLAAPFYYAAVAAALDCEVEIHFAGASVRLLLADVAAQLHARPGEAKSIHAHMQEAAALGVRLLGCAVALREHRLAPPVMIPEFAGTASATDFVMRTLDPEWATMVF